VPEQELFPKIQDKAFNAASVRSTILNLTTAPIFLFFPPFFKDYLSAEIDWGLLRAPQCTFSRQMHVFEQVYCAHGTSDG
jgi:hypothetical protein